MTHAAHNTRRSREAWPETPEPAAEWAPVAHSHELPPWLRRTMLGVGVVLLLFTVGLGALTYYVYLDHEYVQGRGQFRDAEAARARTQTTEQIRSAICGLLDGLPAGPVLDPLRVTYGCGPGIPLEQLPPEAQQQLQTYTAESQQPAVKPLEPPVDRKAPRPNPLGTDAPATPTVVPPPVAPDVPAPVPETPTTAPATPTTAPPLVDLTPLTDPVCSLLGVCL